MKKLFTLAVPIFLLAVTSTEAAKQGRLCQACHQLNDVIEKGLKSTKHKEGLVEEHGRLNAQGVKKGKKVQYANSEARLVEILDDACSGSSNRAECFELVEEEKYYTPIKEWFTSGRKGSFISAVCQKIIPKCSNSAPNLSGGNGDKNCACEGCCTISAYVSKAIGMLPESLKEKPFIQALPGYTDKMQHQAFIAMEAARKYSGIAYRHGLHYSKRLNKQLDKLPVRQYIDKLPLAPKSASFVDQNWKVIVFTLFLALLVPMYYLSCKRCRGAAGANGRRRNNPRSPVMRPASGKKSD